MENYSSNKIPIIHSKCFRHRASQSASLPVSQTNGDAIVGGRDLAMRMKVLSRLAQEGVTIKIIFKSNNTSTFYYMNRAYKSHTLNMQQASGLIWLIVILMVGFCFSQICMFKYFTVKIKKKKKKNVKILPFSMLYSKHFTYVYPSNHKYMYHSMLCRR